MGSDSTMTCRLARLTALEDHKKEIEDIEVDVPVGKWKITCMKMRKAVVLKRLKTLIRETKAKM